VYPESENTKPNGWDLPKDNDTMPDIWAEEPGNGHRANKSFDPYFFLKISGIVIVIGILLSFIGYNLYRTIHDPAKAGAQISVSTSPGPKTTVTRTIRARPRVIERVRTVRATATVTRVRPGPTRTVLRTPKPVPSTMKNDNE